MPIYEYRCRACGENFEILVRSPSRQADPACPKCGSQEVEKAISLFGVGGATTGRTAASVSCNPGSA